MLYRYLSMCIHFCTHTTCAYTYTYIKTCNDSLNHSHIHIMSHGWSSFSHFSALISKMRSMAIAVHIHCTYTITQCTIGTYTDTNIQTYIVCPWFILGHVSITMHQLPKGNIWQCHNHRTEMLESKYMVNLNTCKGECVFVCVESLCLVVLLKSSGNHVYLQ
jgi:hypothetical protein